MSGALLVALCLLAGAGLRARKSASPEAMALLTRVVVEIALPCLTFRGTRALVARSDAGLWRPIAAAWVAFAAAALMLALVARWRRWDRATTGSAMVTATVGNTAFVGLPLIEGLYGRDALATAILVDQGASFVIVSTASVALAARYAGTRSSAAVVLKKLLTFPPVVGSVLGVALARWALPTALDSVIERLASLVVPLALLSVGMRLRLDRASLCADLPVIGASLAVKLALSPMVALLFARAVGLSGRDLRVTIAQCAMAPMVTAGIVATEHDLRPELSSALVAAGVFVSLATVPLWAWALSRAGL